MLQLGVQTKRPASTGHSVGQVDLQPNFETDERMRELGCDIIQGYLFGRPLPYERANDMVMGLAAKKMAG